MKRFLSLVMTLIMVSAALSQVYASDLETGEVTICVNDENAYFGSKKMRITKPVIVFDKTYLNPFDFEKAFDYTVTEENDRLILSSAQAREEFKKIKFWEDLSYFSNPYYSFDDISYISARALAEFVDTKLSYKDGILSFGDTSANSAELFEHSDESDSDYMMYYDYGHSFTLTPNKELSYKDNTEYYIDKPLIIFDKVYVDICDIASALGVKLSWLPDSGQFEAIFSKTAAYFSPIFGWDDINTGRRFFVKDRVHYVSVRDFADAFGFALDFDNWKITVRYGVGADSTKAVSYDETDTTASDEYMYTAYPYDKMYTVYPYTAYSYEMMMSDAKHLEQMYPDIISTDSIGKSVEGRELLLVELGRGDKKIFVCGAHHAREYISTTYLMYAIDRYAYYYSQSAPWNGYNVREILDNVTFCIVPMVNPDGVNLVQNGVMATKNPDYIKSMSINEGAQYGYRSWKANINGVDVNWNYDKDWSINRNKGLRGSTKFNGLEPASEPETRAIQDYVDSIPFEAFLSFHTQGRLIYYCDDVNNPTTLDKLYRRETGFSLTYEKMVGVGGSFFDYVARNFGKTTVTFELCPYVGNFPYPDSDFNTVWAPVKNLLLLTGSYYMYR